MEYLKKNKSKRAYLAKYGIDIPKKAFDGVTLICFYVRELFCSRQYAFIQTEVVIWPNYLSTKPYLVRTLGKGGSSLYILFVKWIISKSKCEFFLEIAWFWQYSQSEKCWVVATPERYVFFHFNWDRSKLWIFYSRLIDFFGLKNDLFLGVYYLTTFLWGNVLMTFFRYLF